ncbi:transmembrane protein 25 isoform X1 [Pangasianodon hypophthalmus]|uniref:transmembrane protein 25 isoform X1 n=1 Tax=Pangasianodon hypophthalmus TaxID=310915 RepID=UPI002306ED0E|nr:transmembrane protein 25 isoform X1 [Pangasianodon hypophthalmus]
MEFSVCIRWRARFSVLLLHTFTWGWTGHARALDPAPRIDGRQHSEVTVQENITHSFNCQSEGWSPQAPPLLSWYLNGERQSEVSGSRGPGRLVMTSPNDKGTMKYSAERNSTFTLRPRKWDRELVCAASNPHGGESYNATVVLNVQFQPEILRVNAHYSETADPGISLVLFALVRSNPPATITWVDQSGQLVANTTDFLILDSRSYPWLANHSLQVMLSSLSGNVSLSANNSLGSAHTNLTLTEFLQSRVEVPMLGIVTGGVAGFVTLLILTLMVLCLLHKDKTKVIEEPVAIPMTQECNRSDKVQVNGVYLPRENMSLPSNVPLNEHSALCKGRLPNSKQNTLTRKTKEDEEEEDLSLAYAARGQRSRHLKVFRQIPHGWLHLQSKQHKQRRDLALIVFLNTHTSHTHPTMNFSLLDFNI